MVGRLEIGTDKVDTDIPAPVSGVLAEVRVAEGETVVRGAGELRVEVRTFPLAELPEAWRAQALSPHAKCVILPEPAEPGA